MNATELAFLLDKSREESYTSEHLVGKAATMLRQQQAEIGCYKIELHLHRAMIQDLENALRKEQEK
jgi:hypothetical protein